MKKLLLIVICCLSLIPFATVKAQSTMPALDSLPATKRVNGNDTVVKIKRTGLIPNKEIIVIYSAKFEAHDWDFCCPHPKTYSVDSKLFATGAGDIPAFNKSNCSIGQHTITPFFIEGKTDGAGNFIAGVIHTPGGCQVNRYIYYLNGTYLKIYYKP